ncbi:collagen alpha-1(I) chain-like [Dasypus novemcinctus]|uniref:collagen alpha-1(I) chain-like n=1 Tax=Dasypus novemcinctus TaxID=9361 RepID=UPI0039C8CDDE
MATTALGVLLAAGPGERDAPGLPGPAGAERVARAPGPGAWRSVQSVAGESRAPGGGPAGWSRVRGARARAGPGNYQAAPGGGGGFDREEKGATPRERGLGHQLQFTKCACPDLLRTPAPTLGLGPARRAEESWLWSVPRGSSGRFSAGEAGREPEGNSAPSPKSTLRDRATALRGMPCASSGLPSLKHPLEPGVIPDCPGNEGAEGRCLHLTPNRGRLGQSPPNAEGLEVRSPRCPSSFALPQLPHRGTRSGSRHRDGRPGFTRRRGQGDDKVSGQSSEPVKESQPN